MSLPPSDATTIELGTATVLGSDVTTISLGSGTASNAPVSTAAFVQGIVSPSAPSGPVIVAPGAKTQQVVGPIGPAGPGLDGAESPLSYDSETQVLSIAPESFDAYGTAATVVAAEATTRSEADTALGTSITAEVTRATAAEAERILPRLAWAPDTVYAVNDHVVADGASFLCLAAHTSGSTFSRADTTHWLQIATIARPVLYVTDFGADPTGVIAFDTAFMACYDAAVAAQLDVMLPPGSTFLTNEPAYLNYTTTTTTGQKLPAILGDVGCAGGDYGGDLSSVTIVPGSSFPTGEYWLDVWGDQTSANGFVTLHIEGITILANNQIAGIRVVAGQNCRGRNLTGFEGAKPNPQTGVAGGPLTHSTGFFTSDQVLGTENPDWDNHWESCQAYQGNGDGFANNTGTGGMEKLYDCWTAGNLGNGYSGGDRTWYTNCYSSANLVGFSVTGSRLYGCFSKFSTLNEVAIGNGSWNTVVQGGDFTGASSGIVAWSSATTYGIGAVVLNTSGNTAYISLTAGNHDNAVTNGTYWSSLGAYPAVGAMCYVGAVGQAVSITGNIWTSKSNNPYWLYIKSGVSAPILFALNLGYTPSGQTAPADGYYCDSGSAAYVTFGLNPGIVSPPQLTTDQTSSDTTAPTGGAYGDVAIRGGTGVWLNESGTWVNVVPRLFPVTQQSVQFVTGLPSQFYLVSWAIPTEVDETVILLPPEPPSGTAIGAKIVNPQAGASIIPVAFSSQGSDTIDDQAGVTTLTLQMLNESAVLVYNSTLATWVIVEHGYALGSLDSRYQASLGITVGSSPDNTTDYLRADGTWDVPPGSSSGIPVPTVTTETSNFTAAYGGTYTASAAATATLPAPAANNDPITFFYSGHVITLAPHSAETINTPIVLWKAGQSVTLFSDGTNWYPLAQTGNFTTLASLTFDPTSVQQYTTAANHATPTALDTTNLTFSFYAPLSGAVDVKAYLLLKVSTAGDPAYFGLLTHGTSTQVGPTAIATTSANYVSNPIVIPLTGLTPGQQYSLDLAFWDDGSHTVTVLAQNKATGTGSPVVFEVVAV